VGRFVKVIAVSNEIMVQLIARGLTGKRTVVLNGIDVNKATAASRPKTELRKGLGIQKDKKVLLSFAWDPFIKGVDLLYEAVTQLGDPDVVLIIVGGSCVKDFISARYGNLIPEWIKFLPPQERIADLYNAVDIFVSASRWEGCPYAVGEAMANGLPVISSNLASLQWSRNGKGVVFFDSLNVANLKIAIADVIHWGPDALESCSQKNKEFINKNYSINQWVDKMISEYSEIQKML
jgi:glycosyltransferase involved in cell wall biosynthesis